MFSASGREFIRGQRPTWFLLLAIVALGGFLRFYQIGSKGLWLDEAFSVWMGWQPVGEMLGWLVKIDQHPPLYYTLLHLWMAFGDRATIVLNLMNADEVLRLWHAVNDGTKGHCALDRYDIVEDLKEVCNRLHLDLKERE